MHQHSPAHCLPNQATAISSLCQRLSYWTFWIQFYHMCPSKNSWNSLEAICLLQRLLIALEKNSYLLRSLKSFTAYPCLPCQLTFLRMPAILDLFMFSNDPFKAASLPGASSSPHPLPLLFFFFNDLCLWEFRLSIHVCTMCVFGAWRSWKRVSNIQTTATDTRTADVWVMETKTWVPCKSI